MESPKSPTSPCPITPDTPEVESKCRKFRMVEDLALLRQVVVEEDPFSKPVTAEMWQKVAAGLGQAFPKMAGIKPRAVKERAEKLVKQHITQENWRAW